MLKENEIIIGGLYAWDSNVTSPRLGCNLFTILEDTHNDCGRLLVESLDGANVLSCGEHCLVPASRINVLSKMVAPKEKTHERWCYDKEFEYLSLFKEAYDTYEEHEKSITEIQG